jgi:hypothetical protein
MLPVVVLAKATELRISQKILGLAVSLIFAERIRAEHWAQLVDTFVANFYIVLIKLCRPERLT